MSTKRVVIEGEERLEGVLKAGSAEAGAVICHPHPLYGGSMHNNVVNAMAEGFSSIGYTTLKFNFRGVGESSGSYDEGEGETRDLVAAFDYLKGVCRPGASLVLAGYSFGAWIVSRAIDLLRGVSSVFLVALPAGIYGSGGLSTFEGPVYLIAGAYDDIAVLRNIQELFESLASKTKDLKIIPTSHFFDSREAEIKAYIKETMGADGETASHES